jgi:hypothetical protein
MMKKKVKLKSCSNSKMSKKKMIRISYHREEVPSPETVSRLRKVLRSMTAGMLISHQVTGSHSTSITRVHMQCVLHTSTISKSSTTYSSSINVKFTSMQLTKVLEYTCIDLRLR